MKEPLIEIKNVSFSYEKGYPVLEDISFRVESKDFLGVVGPNGGGKSTLLKLILGLLVPQEGSIEVFGMTPQEGRSRIGYVPQFKTFSRTFPISVEETILMGCLGRSRWIGGYTKKDRQIVDTLLQKLEIENLKKRSIGTLSGGELQRVMIARALASYPEILLLDEPTSSTDPLAEENLFDLLKEMSQEIAILVVSHDIGFISHYINQVACINRRLVCHQTAPLTHEMLEELYQTPIRLIHHHHREKT
jgi:zinc transport system ATP-binding protein